MNVYVSGAMQEKEVIQGYMARLRQARIDIAIDWTTGEEPKHDDNDQSARIIAQAETAAVLTCDAFWFMVPGYKGAASAWVEFGIALGQHAQGGKRIIVSSPDKELLDKGYAPWSVFTAYPGVVVVDSHEQAFERLVLAHKTFPGVASMPDDILKLDPNIPF